MVYMQLIFYGAVISPRSVARIADGRFPLCVRFDTVVTEGVS